MYSSCLQGGYIIFDPCWPARRAAALAVLLAAVFVLPIGRPGAARADTDSVEFAIIPRLCILSTEEHVCEDQLQARWTSPTARTLCLFRDGRDEPLHCWDKARSGIHQFPVRAADPVQFYLKTKHNGQTAAVQVFDVVHDSREYRRRIRNPWSFF